MNTVTYPKAEQIAKTMKLPIAVDQDTMELYGYPSFILDADAARSELYRYAIYPETHQYDAAIEILRDRISRLN